MDTFIDQRRYLIPFRSNLLPQIFTDTLVLGSGVAGLRAAVSAAAHGDVILVTKGEVSASNTAWAQGGIAAVLDDPDTVGSHVSDTLTAGAGLCDEPVVRSIIEQSRSSIEELIEWGMPLDRTSAGGLSLGREGGHALSRIVHAGGDATGAALSKCLAKRVRSTPGVRVFEQCFALDLITPSAEPGSPVMGAITHHPRYGLQVIWARCTILATGGAGRVYRETTNPPVATADGIATAYRAGADLADMAFVQFHPTTLYLPGATRELISEAVRGEGAHLVDDSGRRFMLEEHELAELAPRDIVSRAIVRQIARCGGTHVWLDARHVPAFTQRFPGITATLRRFELDPASDLIPVHPAAHYTIGGVRTDPRGRTSVPGLYAVGEAACSGMHGANRLASNSLLEGLVMGRLVGDACAADAARVNGSRPGPVSVISDIRPSDHGELDLSDVRSSLRSAMWRNVGIERTGAKLDDCQDMFSFWARYTLDKIFDEPQAWETQNLLTVGALIASSAAWRCESRGCHQRADFPDSREPAEHDIVRRGDPSVRTAPVAPATAVPT